ncbi:MAG: hypothetical protein LBQ58_10635 [Synergistaceae bacterium]|jgi:hypothetical protein|nr:hypothetical protein [Synergistaceae bacterium]
METIILSFTLKGRDFSEIRERIIDIKHRVGENVILLHGFMPRREILKRGFSTEIVDFFEKHFPIQLNMYNEGVLREEMADIAQRLNATVYVIGEIKHGVSEEFNLYNSRGLDIVEISFNDKAGAPVQEN